MATAPILPASGPELLDLVSDAWAGHLVAQRRGRSTDPRSYVYASARRACVRRMALDLMFPGDEPEPSAEALERMQRGKEREDAIIARLMHVGRRCAIPFEVIEGQRRFEIRDRDGSTLIVGKVDGRLGFHTGERPIFECKSGEVARHVDSLEDLDRSPWSRHWLDQLLAYLYAEGEAWGFLILDRPSLPKLLPVVLEDHLDRAETFLRDARAAVDARFERAPLPAYTADRAECRRCPHNGRSCTPDADFGDGVQLITDDRLIYLAEQREKNAEAAKVYDRADAELKKALRGVELGILGPYQVTGRWQRKTTVNVPAEIKAQYTTVDPQGSFRLDIERIA